MKKIILILSLSLAAIFSTSTYALVAITGAPVAVYTDPSDVVVQLNQPGPCGSNFYHIRRAKVNFNQFFTVAQQALFFRRNMVVFVESCSGDRNLLSHGAAF